MREKSLSILFILTLGVLVQSSTTYLYTTPKYKIHHDYSYNDFALLSKLVNSEAVGSSDRRDAFLVASVVLNRVGKVRFGLTIKEVIFQENQFYGISSPQFRRTPFSDDTTSRILNGCYRTRYVFYFYGRDCKHCPPLFKGKRVVIKTTKHIFLR